ncbi:MAG: DUF4836 family protein [Bacteroidota bacterium]|nr:DUF4836 family protein [Bacteroidota bacterium]
MKRILSILAPVLVAVSLLTVSCKSDKGPANDPAVDAFLSEAPYACALPDNPNILIALHPLQILAKSEFATDEEFDVLRDMLFEDLDPASRLAVLAVLQNPALAGLDPQHPILAAMTNIEVKQGGQDVSADLYAVVPLTSRELLLTSLEKVGEKLDPDADGRYLYTSSDYSLIITDKAVVCYAVLDKVLSAEQLRSTVLKASQKTSLSVTGKGVENLFAGGNDLAIWGDDHLTEYAYKTAGNKLDVDLIELLGGNPGKDISAFVSLDFLPGKVALTGEAFGSNALFDRFLSWVGTPEHDALKAFNAENALGAGQIAFANLSDALDFLQGVLERSGEADGIVIADVIRAFGVESKDLDEIGTVSGVVYLDENSHYTLGVVAHLGKKVVSAIEKGAASTGLWKENLGLLDAYSLGGGIYAGFVEENALIGSREVLTNIYGESFLTGSRLAPILNGNSLAVDLSRDALIRMGAPSLLYDVTDYAVATLDESKTKGRFDLVLEDKEHNAARTALQLVYYYFHFRDENIEGSAWDDEDFDYDPDFDYLY